LLGGQFGVLLGQHITGEANTNPDILMEIQSISIKDLTSGCFNLRKRKRKRPCQCHSIELVREDKSLREDGVTGWMCLASTQ